MKDKTIDTILASMFAGALSQPELATWNEAKRQLIALDSKADAALEHHARSLLAAVADVPEAEEQLWVLLEAMAIRGQAAVEEITMAALRSDATAEKEGFLDVLWTKGGAKAATMVAQTLRDWSQAHDSEGWIRRKAINILAELKAQDHIGVIEQALDAKPTTVRETAVRALRKLDARQSAPLLVARLPVEDSDLVVVELAHTLDHWDEKSAVPALIALKDSHWPDQSPQLKTALTQAISRLTRDEK